jgi:hypothetical protein
MRVKMFACVMLLSLTALLVKSDAQTVPTRNLGPALAVAKDRMNANGHAIPLTTGNVFLVSGSRVLLLDSTLALVRVVADSSSFTPGRRPLQNVTAIPHVADSLLVVDFNATGFLLVDPQGNIVRPVAAPKSGDVNYFTPFWSGLRSDSRGQLIYRAAFPRAPTPAARATAPVDTFPIVRANFETRLVDTLAVVRVSNGEIGTTMRMEGSRLTARTTRQPLPTTDSWVALPDGAVAIVRGSDYHVDWINTDGSKTSTPKLSFDWRRITEEEKLHIIDSLTKVEAKLRILRDSLIGTGALVYPPGVPAVLTEFVSPKELPDYYPPVRDGMTQADPDGNVWILPNTSLSARGGLLYDVVNRNGDHFRVQLPPGCALSGLGAHGNVFLICNGSRLERRRIIQS